MSMKVIRARRGCGAFPSVGFLCRQPGQGFSCAGKSRAQAQWGAPPRQARTASHFSLGEACGEADITMPELAAELAAATPARRPIPPRFRVGSSALAIASKTYGPPRLQGVCRDWRLISLLQRIRPRGFLRPRWRYARSGPHKIPGVERRFLNQDAGTPFDCRPSRRHPLANPCRPMDAERPIGRTLTPHQHSPNGEPFPTPQHRPGDYLRQLVGEGDDRHVVMSASHELFSPIGQAACRAQPHRAKPHAPHGSTACAGTCCRAC